MNSRSSLKAAGAIGLLLAVCVTGPALALTDEEIFRDFRFNFINPGGRALGLGGAYIAAADDATAVEANPAALHYINRLELFGEYRSLSRDDFQSGASEGSVGLDALDTPFLELQATTEQEDRNLGSFASFAVPFRLGKARATAAISRQVVLDVESSLKGASLDYAFGDAIWINDDADGGPAVERYTVNNASLGSLDAELVNWNLGFSFSLGNDLSIGLTGTYAQLDMQSILVNRVEDPAGSLTTLNPRVDEDDDGNFDDVFTQSTIDDDDAAVSWTLGLHYHPDSRFESGYSPIRLGVVYRKGAELNVDQTVIVDPGSQEAVREFVNTLRVPDRYGFGISGELGRGWIFALDLERIEYSDLLENYRTGVNFFTSGLIPEAELDLNEDPVVFDVDDATVVHVGAEYNLITRGRWTYGFRAGYFNAPDNRIRMIQFNSDDEVINNLFENAFGGGTDEDHFTGGFSFSTPVGLRLQFAGDFSDVATQIVMSAIWRIGKVRR